MRPRIIAFLLTLLALLAVACGSDAVTVDAGAEDDGVQANLDAARDRWAAAEMTEYVLEWSPTCFCPAVTFTDTISAGQVVSHEEEGESFFESTGKTMDDLFSEIQLALDDGPFQIEAEFDPGNGAVRSYYVDVEEMMADEEYGVVVHSVVPVVAELPGGPTIEASVFTVDYGCGHGFAKGSEDQTTGFVMFFTGEWSEDGPSLAEPIDLTTTDEWSATISVGADLFATWCDDAIEEDDPVPQIDAEYRIVQGLLNGTVDGNTASATLSNIVAEAVSGSGDVVEISELQLVNDSWGFFAG